MEISSASREDLAEVAEIHVQSWKETYVGLVPQTYLDGLDPKIRLEKWREGFEAVEKNERGLYIANEAGIGVGFASIGPARDEKYHDYGEIYAIYVLKAYWGTGVGYRLFRAAENWLKSKGFRQIYLWVLDANLNAMGSYLKWGGQVDKDINKHHEIAGQVIREVQVVFNIQ